MHFMWAKIRHQTQSLFVILATFTLSACVSTPIKPGKLYETCVCGPTTNSEARPYCAIWAAGPRAEAPRLTYKALPQDSCSPSDCSRLFSEFCQKIQMVEPQLATLPKASPEPCFCDSLLMENEKGQVKVYCAAWVPGAAQVLEYHAVDCHPQRCLEPPFGKAKVLCQGRFRPFYQPLPTGVR